MRTAQLTRRRFITISAAAAGSLLAGPTAAGSAAVQWSGVALGAAAVIRIEDPDRARARRLLRSCAREIARLEDVFSLYRSDSELSRLNRDGRLSHPSADMLRLLSMAQGVHHSTQGAFDPTVQPLWALYARHFRARRTIEPSGPASEQIANVQRSVGMDLVAVRSGEIRFEKPAMAITLNGIAQGYITDRVADLLRSFGLLHVLVHVGETRAIGARSNGRPWDIKVPTSSTGQTGRTIALADAALATSATSGTTFDDEGQVGHIIDPRTGRPPAERRQVTVTGPSAALADAYSTAFCLLPHDTHGAIAEPIGYSIV